MKKKKHRIFFFTTQLIKWLLPKDERSFLSGDIKEIYDHMLETDGQLSL